MAIRQNAFYYNGSAGQGIKSGLDNLGAMFAPPSIQDAFLAQKIRSDNAAAQARQLAQGRIAGGTAGLSDYQAAGYANPELADLYSRATAPGATQASVDAAEGAVHGYKATQASQTQEEANQQLMKMFEPMSSGQERVLPPSAAEKYGVPSTQYAPVTLAAGSNQIRTAPDGTTSTVAGPDKDATSNAGIAAGITSKMTPADFQNPTPQQQWALKVGGSGQNINVNGAENAFNQGVGKEDAKTYGSIVDAGRAAPTTIEQANQLDASLAAIKANGGTVGGSMQPAVLNAQKNINAFLTSAGAPAMFDENTVADKDVVNKLSMNMLTSQFKNMFGARPAASELTMLQKAYPNLENSEGGNAVIIDAIRQTAQRNQGIAQAVQDARTAAAARGQPFDGNAMYAVENQYVASHPLQYRGVDMTSPAGQAALNTDFGAKPAAPGAPAAPSAAPAQAQAPAPDPSTMTLDQLKAVDPTTIPTAQLPAYHDAYVKASAAAQPAAPAAPSAPPTAAPAMPSPVAAPAPAPAAAPMPVQGAQTAAAAPPAAPPAVTVHVGAPGAAPATPIVEAASATPAPAVIPQPQPQPVPDGPASMTTPFMQNLMRSLSIGQGGGAQQ